MATPPRAYWRRPGGTTSKELAHTSVNVYTSAEAEDRNMRTGKHTVRDLYCRVCHQVLGWKYVSTVEAMPANDSKEEPAVTAGTVFFLPGRQCHLSPAAHS